jgi:hypothetical protein
MIAGQASVLLPSVQSLFIEMCFGQVPLATATAFSVKSKRGPLLITNWHNVTGRDHRTHQPISDTGGIPDTLRIVHLDHNGSWTVKTEPLLENGNPRWIEHPQLGERADIAALPLTDLTSVQLYPYDPSGGAPIQITPAEPVSVVGFPFGLQVGGSAVWATGFVASEPELNFNDLPVLLIDCRARPGQSGSPVIAYRSGGAVPMTTGRVAVGGGPFVRFLGVYSGRVNKESDLGFVWKASAVDELAASA